VLRALLAAAMLWIPAALSAQFGAATAGAFEYPATVAATFDPPVARAGETVRLDVAVTVKAGYHVYSMDPLVDPEAYGPFATILEFAPPPGYVAPDDLEEPVVFGPPAGLEAIEGEEWTEPAPKIKYDTGFETQVRYFTGKVVFSRKFRVAAEPPAEIEAKGAVRMQLCDENSCLPPRATPFSAKLLGRAADGAVPVPTATPTPEPTATPEPTPEPTATPEAKGAGTAAPPAPKPPAKPQSESAKLAERGPFGIVGVAFGLGLLSLLTPCVFPMIPITISFFTKRAAKTTGQRIRLCTVYAGSIVFGFAVVGFGLAVALKVLGIGIKGAGAVNQFAANPWVNIALAVVFLLFAFSLFGAFEIGLPASWANRLQQKGGGRSDAMGAFFMAMVFVIVSFTCTAPIVGPLIVLTFEGSWLTPFVGLTAYAAGFALPFFVLGLLPGALASLPKSGSWLNATKVVMGLVEIAAAMKFVSNTDLVWQWNVFTREVLLAAWAAIALVCGAYLLGMFRTSKDGPDAAVGPGRLLFGTAFASMALYFAFGLFAGRLHPSVESLLPPTTMSPVAASSGGGSKAAPAHEYIRNDLDAAIAQSRRENKPLFIDFTGWTCTNCRLNEIKIFPQPEVKKLMDEYVIVQLYTDDLGKDAEGNPIGEKYQEYQAREFGTITLPFYATLSPDGEKLANFSGLVRDAEEFKAFLKVGLKDA